MQARPLPLPLFALAALGPLALIAAGLALGGGWLWAGFLYMAVLTLVLDQLIPLTAAPAEDGEFPAADALLVAAGCGALVLLPLATWGIAGASGLTGGQRVLLFFAAGFWLGQVAHPAAHELIHRPRRALFRLGATVYSALLFGQHASAHRLVHHCHVASRDDPNTARAGESFYRFAPRAWIGSFREGAKAETALRKGVAGRGLHPYAAYLAIGLAALALAFLIAGLPGLLAWVCLALHAQSQILLSDYVQHYGLTRTRRPDGKPEPVGPAHSWNTAHWFSSAMMLNAPRHSDHHVHPGRAFPALILPPADEAPRLPWPLPLACALALAPRTWRRAIAPHLARWRETRPAAAPADTAA
ncbi:alkane 1-monooxygenase [Rhodobacter calidifons]|uniref:Alkane 1-monooxygenase n=1 Tax=Rhodobacter calidifons TaxID=2715277 RepID=A0ABX0G611_9RHOB|nr:alkane 1-monooxygenase [Rhodobacter calidifons]NHB76690.1 alkane 1-monooxygenase [Rhodobacter calidifons]